MSTTQLTTDEKLWQSFTMDFRLQCVTFSEKRIHAQVKIEPDKARDLIQNFELISDGVQSVPFDSSFQFISVVGFAQFVDKTSIYIRAIPRNPQFRTKQSNSCTFTMQLRTLPLVPTVRFQKPPRSEEDPKSRLIVRWSHIDDRIADRYVLRIDGTDVCYIHKKQICYTMQVNIRNLESNSEHDLQVIAQRGIKNQETCRSDVLFFVVPTEIPESGVQIVNVHKELDTNDHPKDADMNTKEEQNEMIALEKAREPSAKNSLESRRSSNPQPKQKETLRNSSVIPPCCFSGPHDKFPGIEHYFINNTHKNTPHTTARSSSYDDDQDVQGS